MRTERKVPFLMLVICLAVVTPLAWASGGRHILGPAGDAQRADDLERGSAGKVMICHHPPGNPSNAQTITVGQSAVAAHLAHGDSLGACPPPCVAGPPAPVPRTGQTGCWGEYGSPIDCAGTGQDGEYKKGASVSPRFTDNDNGTVTDNLTGLIWLKDANCFGYQHWTTALSLANALASGNCGLTDGSLAGDWRLPNVKELQSLIDYDQYLPALPPGHPFAGVQSIAYYWSSSTNASYPGTAWIVYLYDGFVVSDSKYDYDYVVWPVRGGQ